MMSSPGHVRREVQYDVADQWQERSLVKMAALMFLLGIATFAAMLGFVVLCEKV
jgi:hypothetical protein